MHRAALPLLAVTGMALSLAVAGCSGAAEPEEEYTAPPAVGAPAADALQPDGSTVDAGQWGVVRYLSTSDEETVLAIRTANVVAGQPGELGDVTVPGQSNLDEATPYYVAYTWTNLSGDDAFSPVQNLAADGAGDPSTLLVPDDLEKCDPRPATDDGASFGAEHRGCVVVVSTAGPPTTLVFQGPQGSSKDVAFALSGS